MICQAINNRVPHIDAMRILVVILYADTVTTSSIIPDRPLAFAAYKGTFMDGEVALIHAWTLGGILVCQKWWQLPRCVNAVWA